MAHTRATDPPIVKVTRDIPLPWLIGLVAAGIAQAVLMYAGQQRQAELIQDQSAKISSLTVQIQGLVEQVNKVNLANVGYEYRITDMDRRLRAVEEKKR